MTILGASFEQYCPMRKCKLQRLIIRNEMSAGFNADKNAIMSTSPCSVKWVVINCER